MKITQISVFLENRPGQLNNVMQLMAEAGVDLRAINIAETSDYGVARIVADDLDKACSVLKENGNIYSLTDVAAVEVQDKPGGLATILDRLSEAGIDIEYMYSCFGGQSGNALMVLKVADPDAASALF